MSKPQILILEEQGISRSDFEEIFNKEDLAFEIVWFDSESILNNNLQGIITVKTKVNNQMLLKYPNVKFVAVAFTGYDCVDLDLCKQKDIAVFNVPAYSTNSVAELAVALTISILREIPKADKILRKGQWMLESPGIELAGKTVGILGTGSIGIKTAQIFKAIGCNVIGYSRTERDNFKEIGKYIASMSELFTMADIISIHVPLNSETKGLVSYKEIAAMKKTAFIVNTARGPIVDEKELINALKNKRIAGAGIDVFETEPTNADNELLKLQNTIVTPHIAFKTIEALNRRADVTINNIKCYIEGKDINRVC